MNRFADMQDDDLFDKRPLLDDAHMRGRLEEPESIRRFIEAGNATITIVSRKTSTRYTLRFSRPSEEDARERQQHFAVRPIWVSLLSGADNESNYSFMGTIFPTKSVSEMVASRKSRVTQDAPSWIAARWFLRALYMKPEELEKVEVWHEGRCGRCGRKLTVPESVKNGFGPECSSKMGY